MIFNGLSFAKSYLFEKENPFITNKFISLNLPIKRNNTQYCAGISNHFMTKNELKKILESIRYFDSFKSLIKKTYSNIEYGKRLGTKSFNSLFDADAHYNYNGKERDELFESWNKTLNSKESTEEDLLIVCLEIFDWGKVLNSNVKTAIELYKQNELKNYLNRLSDLLKVEKTLNTKEKEYEIIWTSGWTKVYSFMNNDIIIYDSRVSAFLNFSLIQNYDSFDLEQITNFKKLTKLLFSFGGFNKRERKVDKKYGFKNQHPKEINGFNSNLISSWIVQLTIETLNLEQNVRAFERAFFMLGFDLKQIKTIDNRNSMTNLSQ